MSKLYTLAIGIGSDSASVFHADTCARAMLRAHPIDPRTTLIMGRPEEDLVTIRMTDTSPAALIQLEIDLNRMLSGEKGRGSLRAWWRGTAAKMPSTRQ